VKADAEAFRKFKACNYDYARVVPIVRLARQVPLFGLFTSFVSESHRVVWNSFVRPCRTSEKASKRAMLS